MTRKIGRSQTLQGLIGYVKGFRLYSKSNGKILEGFIQGCGVYGQEDMTRFTFWLRSCLAVLWRVSWRKPKVNEPRVLLWGVGNDSQAACVDGSEDEKM